MTAGDIFEESLPGAVRRICDLEERVRDLEVALRASIEALNNTLARVEFIERLELARAQLRERLKEGT